MKPIQGMTPALALAGTLLASGALMAADTAQVDHSAHHPAPEPAQPQATAQAKPATADMQMMQNRMMEIRSTQDPEKRMQLMEAQMKDMEAMLKAPSRSCPMAESQGGMKGGHGGMDMKGGHGGMGMMGEHGGMGMKGKGMSGQSDMLEKRMELMEKRMDLMQMLLQKSMGTP